MMRVLVVTLHTDEPQFDWCRASVADQTNVDVEHVTLSGLSNVEAHRRCYELIQLRAAWFDFAVKLDADMVLASDTVLNAIGRLMDRSPGVDHLSFAVDDFFTAGPLMGLQVFSPRVSWQLDDEELFVDPSPQIPGRRMDLWQPGFRVAAHAPEPSSLQAFRFGVHRALKAVQPCRDRVRGSQAVEQWRILMATWNAFESGRDHRRGTAISGAEAVLSGALDGSVGYRCEAVSRALSCVPDGVEDLRSQLRPGWERMWRRNLRRFRRLGPASSLRVLAAGARMAVSAQ